MAIRFAAARSGHNRIVARTLRAPGFLRAANDNIVGLCSDALLKAALQHFAEYGLGAAANAAMMAEAHHFANDGESYRWWLSICRTLDKRRAERLAKRLEAGEPRRARR